MRKWIPVAVMKNVQKMEFNEESFFSFYLKKKKKAFKREFNCSYQTHYNGNKTENTHPLLFEVKKFVLMSIRSQIEWTINFRSFYMMRTHYSSNEVDNFTFVRCKTKHKMSTEKKIETKIAGRTFWNEKKKKEKKKWVSVWNLEISYNWKDVGQ